MLRAAALLGERAGEIAAVASLEVGKNRVQSMGEVDEAAELMGVYRSQMRDGLELELESEPAGRVHRSAMRPCGVFGVIAPFIFPMALTTGPATGALAAGNTVVVKPSPTTSWTGMLLGDVLREAGLPDGVFNLVTCSDVTGRALVESPDVDGIVFTGSHAVSMQIARTFAGEGAYPRPSIIEMGGKNPAIVSRSADLSIAASGIVRSAFGLSGQKCSACSWVLVDETVHGELIERLVAETKSWTVAEPTSQDCRLGPVHTSEAFERYEAVVAEARRDGRVAAGDRVLRDGELAHGWFVAPTIVADLASEQRLTRESCSYPYSSSSPYRLSPRRLAGPAVRCTASRPDCSPRTSERSARFSTGSRQGRCSSTVLRGRPAGAGRGNRRTVAGRGRAPLGAGHWDDGTWGSSYASR